MSDTVTISVSETESVTVSVGEAVPSVAPSTWDQWVAEYGKGYNFPPPTGQTTSYRTGDDANIESTVFGSTVRNAETLKARNTLSDITTLNNTNSFGNTNRFTYTDGTQTYTTNYKIDHFTGLAWDFNVQSSLDFDGHIDGALAHSFEGFTDWFLPNKAQMMSMHNSEDGNYGLSFLANGILSTSTTNDQSTTQNYITQSNNRFINAAKTSTYLAVYCRKHF